jgi:hypothetical protein
MGTFEFRVCAIPDPEQDNYWDVTVYMRPVPSPDPVGGWRLVHTAGCRSAWQGDRPATYFREILKACKV